MQIPRVDVDKVENMQAALTSVKSLIELIISDAESKASFYKDNEILSDSFGDIAVALNGVHLLIIGINEHNTINIAEAFQAAQKGETSNAEEANRA
jgi:hypothetical protein